MKDVSCISGLPATSRPEKVPLMRSQSAAAQGKTDVINVELVDL